MGFGSVAAQVIFFIAVVMIASSIVVIANEQMQDNAQAYRIRSERLNNQISTSISILSITYNESIPRIDIYARNDGKTKLILDNTDVFVDGLRVSRSDRSIVVEPDTDIGNALIWDPSEIIHIQVNQAIGPGIVPVRVTTDYDAYAQDSISQ
jgi:archaellum component FlaF (FlaF/FlaG flagellin family)